VIVAAKARPRANSLANAAVSFVRPRAETRDKAAKRLRTHWGGEVTFSMHRS